jgi:hypothetical protein
MGVVERKYCLVKAGRSNGRGNGGQLAMMYNTGNHRLLRDGPQASPLVGGRCERGWW